jgi:iron complex transport system ATP-binding protein
MDLDHQAKIGQLLRELASEGYGIILVAHDLNLACEWADDAFLIGKISDGRAFRIYGRVQDVLTSKNLEELYPGAKLQVAPSPSTNRPKVFFGE